MIAIYNIPDGEKEVIDGPFNNEAFNQVIEDNGWLFIHANTCLIEVLALKGLKIKNEIRVPHKYHGEKPGLNVLESRGKKNGLVVQTAAVEDYKSDTSAEELKRFISDVKNKTEIDSSEIAFEKPRLKFKTLTGDWLDIQFDIHKKINGKDIDLTNWPIIKNTWIYQMRNRKKMVINFNKSKLIYDFENWEILSGNR